VLTISRMSVVDKIERDVARGPVVPAGPWCATTGAVGPGPRSSKALCQAPIDRDLTMTAAQSPACSLGCPGLQPCLAKAAGPPARSALRLSLLPSWLGAPTHRCWTQVALAGVVSPGVPARFGCQHPPRAGGLGVRRPKRCRRGDASRGCLPAASGIRPAFVTPVEVPMRRGRFRVHLWLQGFGSRRAA